MTSDIGVQTWMTEPDTMLVIAALEALFSDRCNRVAA